MKYKRKYLDFKLINQKGGNIFNDPKCIKCQDRRDVIKGISMDTLNIANVLIEESTNYDLELQNIFYNILTFFKNEEYIDINLENIDFKLIYDNLEEEEKQLFETEYLNSDSKINILYKKIIEKIIKNYTNQNLLMLGSELKSSKENDIKLLIGSTLNINVLLSELGYDDILEEILKNVIGFLFKEKRISMNAENLDRSIIYLNLGVEDNNEENNFIYQQILEKLLEEVDLTKEKPKIPVRNSSELAKLLNKHDEEKKKEALKSNPRKVTEDIKLFPSKNADDDPYGFGNFGENKF